MPSKDEPDEKAPSKYAQKIWRDGKRYRIMYKTIYYKGASYTVDEEVLIDSDEESSVHTSEDSFIEDDIGVRESMKKDEIPTKKEKIAHIVNEKNIINACKDIQTLIDEAAKTIKTNLKLTITNQ